MGLAQAAWGPLLRRPLGVTTGRDQLYRPICCHTSARLFTLYVGVSGGMLCLGS